MSTFTPHQEFLAARAEEAVRDGLQLFRWVQDTNLDAIAFPLNLGQQYRLSNRATGYFGTLTINEKTESVMGCRQQIEFGPAAGVPVTPEEVVEFMAVEFLPRANWKDKAGTPGGFTIAQDVYRDKAGALGLFAEDKRKGCVDWRTLGKDLEWVVLTVDIHDFVMGFGPIRKRFKEAACVAPHPGFMNMAENPTPETAFEYTIGYPFVKFAPIPNVFGFGPGKFGTAIKLYTMRLGRDGRVKVQMDFAAAPRCPKVFDFGERWPDPVYGMGRTLEKVSFGLFKFQNMRDKMEAQMLAQHCRVHQSLMDGVELVWHEWLRTSKKRVNAG